LGTSQNYRIYRSYSVPYHILQIRVKNAEAVEPRGGEGVRSPAH